MNDLKGLVALANALTEAEAKTKEAEADLKKAKKIEQELREESLPALMHELGVEDVTLSTGLKLSIKQDVYAAIPAAKRAEAYSWLEENDFGDLIKVEVKAEYGRGESKAALELYEELVKRGLQSDMKQSVHASTLKAFLREQIREGKPVPMDLFGARPVWTATVK